MARLQAGGGQAMLFSALTKQGVNEVSQLLWQWTHPDVASRDEPEPA
jgi:GTP-binding protein